MHTFKRVKYHKSLDLAFDHDQLRLVGKWKRDLLAKFLRKVSHDFEDWVLDLKPSPPIHVKCFFEPLYLLFSIFYVQMVYDPKEIFRNMNSCVNTHHDTTIFKVDGIVINLKKLNSSRAECNFSIKWKNSAIVLKITFSKFINF